jgi:acetoacetate decarboxylase
MTKQFRFGPATLPAVTVVERQTTTALSFITDSEAIRWMLPRHFAPAERPVVTFMHQALHNVDYMRGRGYNLLNVAVSATFESDGGTLHAPFPLVIWENNTMPIIAGRELHGNPKIYGDVSDLAEQDGQLSFNVAEYGAALITGRVTALQEATPDRVARTNAGAADARFFGWKNIPSADGGTDVDYATLIRGASRFDRVWSGQGHLEIHAPTPDEAPYSSEVVQALAQLPRLQERTAFYGIGTAQLFRNRTVRLRPRADSHNKRLDS